MENRKKNDVCLMIEENISPMISQLIDDQFRFLPHSVSSFVESYTDSQKTKRTPRYYIVLRLSVLGLFNTIPPDNDGLLTARWKK